MFRNMEYIYEVYKEQSFCKAAEKLHVSQPALSAMVKRIEAQLGMPVFNRLTSPISLTPFGAEYIRSIETVRSLETHLKDITYKMKTLQTGSLSICGYNLYAEHPIPEIIAGFMRNYPNIRINLIGTNTIRSKQLLDSGEIDFFFSSKVLDKNEYCRVPVFQDPLVLVVPREHEINGRFKECQLSASQLRHLPSPKVPCVNLSNFRECTFIISNQYNNLRSVTDTLFREAGFTPNIVLEVEESGIAPGFVRYGIGATLAPLTLIRKSQFKKHFCVYKLNSSYSTRTGSVYYRSNAYITPAMNCFLSSVQEFARSGELPPPVTSCNN